MILSPSKLPISCRLGRFIDSGAVLCMAPNSLLLVFLKRVMD